MDSIGGLRALHVAVYEWTRGVAYYFVPSLLIVDDCRRIVTFGVALLAWFLVVPFAVNRMIEREI
jgi:hypothetical protein